MAPEPSGEVSARRYGCRRRDRRPGGDRREFGWRGRIMAHGTRKRWLRVATTGFGVLLCTGLVGCLNDDKSKDTKAATKQLPGTPRLDANGNVIGKTGQPTTFNGPPPGGSVQPGMGAYPGAGNIQQPGYQTQPAGQGLGAGPSRSGLNTLNTTAPQPTNGGPPSPSSGVLGTPSVQGYGQPVSSAGGPGMNSPYLNSTPGGIATSPPPPDLATVPLPPPPPDRTTGFGTGATRCPAFVAGSNCSAVGTAGRQGIATVSDLPELTTDDSRFANAPSVSSGRSAFAAASRTGPRRTPP